MVRVIGRTLLGVCLCLGAAALSAPQPAQAQLPPGMKPFETTKVADGVYSFRFFFHRNMFLVTDEGVIATDPINSKAAEAMMAEIRKVTDKPVKYVIYSHEHWDHVSGGKIFKDAGATFVSHENCLPFFKRRPNPAVVVPDETYSGAKHEITLGNRTVELHHFGPSHGQCMTVMRLPGEKLLFVVDIVNPKRVAFRGMPDFLPGEWVRSLKEIEALDFERIIPGHGPATAPRSAVTAQREYLEDLIEAVKVAAAETPNLAKIQEKVKLPKYEQWGFYKEWLPMNIERIYLYHRMGH